MTLESDGDDTPRKNHEAAREGDWRPYSLRVYDVALVASDDPPAVIAARMKR